MELTASDPIASPMAEIEQLLDKQSTGYGILIALCVISLWATSLGTLLTLNMAKLPVWLIPLAVLWQMFLYTGLFITAHDAMHGLACPQSLKINRFIGTLTVAFYGLFSYKQLVKKHGLHHRYPASDRDPDFHDGQHKNPVLWYFYFMSRYWSWKQFIGLTIVFHTTHYALHIPQTNLAVFWILPSILSSIQLFYFGTFLTHREPESGFTNSHRAQTNPLPTFWSFITCYHFGYHEEHHEYPDVPWWQLSSIHKAYRSNFHHS
jgi:beta-carotene/zeaxanthin 4-ketolase